MLNYSLPDGRAAEPKGVMPNASVASCHHYSGSSLMMMLRHAILALGATATVACAHSPSSDTVGRAATLPVYSDTAEFRIAAQAVVNAFSAELSRAGVSDLGAVPAVQIRNTPQLIFFSGSSNTIVAPWWGTQPEAMRSVFEQFAGGGSAEAEHLFRAFFNRFLLAHEAAHWFQARAGRREATLYANENVANRIAVAFWRTQPDGEALLSELERLAGRAAANLPDPTPPGEDAVAYFGANYQALGADPLKYGYYQFRFMREALRERRNLDLATLVRGPR